MATDTESAAPTYQQVVASWNAQADEHNQWGDLGEDEKIEWAFSLALKYHPELIAWYVTGCSTLLDERDAKAEAKRCGGSAKAVPLYSIPD